MGHSTVISLDKWSLCRDGLCWIHSPLDVYHFNTKLNTHFSELFSGTLKCPMHSASLQASAVCYGPLFHLQAPLVRRLGGCVRALTVYLLELCHHVALECKVPPWPTLRSSPTWKSLKLKWKWNAQQLCTDCQLISRHLWDVELTTKCGYLVSATLCVWAHKLHSVYTHSQTCLASTWFIVHTPH